MSTPLRIATILISSVALLAGCASQSGSSYSREQTRHELTVRMGVVDSVRHVSIEGTKSPVGAGAGAVIGGVAGSTVGQGRGSGVASILGAIAGGVAGAVVEEKATKKDGLEITVKLENGAYIAVTQEADEEFKPGERVRILSGDGATRVSH